MNWIYRQVHVQMCKYMSGPRKIMLVDAAILQYFYEVGSSRKMLVFGFTQFTRHLPTRHIYCSSNCVSAMIVKISPSSCPSSYIMLGDMKPYHARRYWLDHWCLGQHGTNSSSATCMILMDPLATRVKALSQFLFAWQTILSIPTPGRQQYYQFLLTQRHRGLTD